MGVDWSMSWVISTLGLCKLSELGTDRVGSGWKVTGARSL